MEEKPRASDFSILATVGEVLHCKCARLKRGLKNEAPYCICSECVLVESALGFVETSSFTAAFRRSAGLTPSSYRRQLGQIGGGA